MKKIGILFGQENTFPHAFVDKVNSKNEKDIHAEFVSINKVVQGEGDDYAVIIDRISQDVPFYRSFLKNAALNGTAVINNPFWWSADEKFFNNCLATKIGVPVPKTVLLPSREHPDDTSAQSFRNLAFPLDWDGIFSYVGFPAYMKPFAGGGWKSVYRINDMEDFFRKHYETGQLVMMLQEEIVFEEYFRCYCIGGKYVKIMPYEPRNPHHLRYVVDGPPASTKLLKTIEDYVIRLNKYLGYDFNTVEFAVRDGIPYAIDFCNPAPDADVHSVGQENFDWVVEHAAKFAIEKAKAHKPNADNLTWGQYLNHSVNKTPLVNPDAASAKATTAKPAPAKKEEKKAAPSAPKADKAIATPAAKPAPTAVKKAAAKPVTEAPKVEKAEPKKSEPKAKPAPKAKTEASVKTETPKAARKPAAKKPATDKADTQKDK